ncbi:hypothetical protein ACOMHN_051389 [Nucella lapillus]
MDSTTNRTRYLRITIPTLDRLNYLSTRSHSEAHVADKPDHVSHDDDDQRQKGDQGPQTAHHDGRHPVICRAGFLPEGGRDVGGGEIESGHDGLHGVLLLSLCLPPADAGHRPLWNTAAASVGL